MILAGAGGASLEGEGPAAAERGGLRPEDGRDGAVRGGARRGWTADALERSERKLREWDLLASQSMCRRIQRRAKLPERNLWRLVEIGMGKEGARSL